MNIGWFVVIYFVIQVIVSIVSKRGNKSSRPQRQPRGSGAGAGGVGAGGAGGVGAGSGGRGAPMSQGANPTSPTKEDAAVEISRMMGLEPSAAVDDAGRVEILEETLEEPEPVRVEIVPDQPRHGGGLHDRMTSRDDRGALNPGHLDQRHLSSGLAHRQVGSGRIGGAQLARPLGGRLRPSPVLGRGGSGGGGAKRFTGSRHLSLDDLAQAIVIAEVIGKPLALREDRW